MCERSFWFDTACTWPHSTSETCKRIVLPQWPLVCDSLGHNTSDHTRPRPSMCRCIDDHVCPVFPIGDSFHRIRARAPSTPNLSLSVAYGLDCMVSIGSCICQIKQWREKNTWIISIKTNCYFKNHEKIFFFPCLDEWMRLKWLLHKFTVKRWEMIEGYCFVDLFVDTWEFGGQDNIHWLGIVLVGIFSISTPF